MKKRTALRQWRELSDSLPILPHMTPIPYKSKGSTYGACGVRIDGNPAFVDAVLSRLKDIIPGENGLTRLGLSRREVTSEFKPCLNRDTGAEVCYIRLHVRGRQSSARMCPTTEERAASEQYVAANGIIPTVFSAMEV